ncbi:MAG: hypothetical protein Q8Q09_20415 [Deltaproteobacteria bacterium]|nr:hypothetical protein [Deltaproteobacteria bacterium]
MSALDHDAVDALLARASALRWLAPDAEMALPSPAAVQWIEDRVDEHRAALDAQLREDEPRCEPPLQLTRSMYDARFAAGYVGDEGGRFARDIPAFSPRVTRWAELLDRARRQVFHAARAQLGDTTCAVLLARMQSVLLQQGTAHAGIERSLVDKLRRWISRDPSARLMPGGELWWCEILRVACKIQGQSPWAPLLAMWERGLAPLATLQGELLVYLPLYASHDTLDHDPDLGPDSRQTLAPNDLAARFANPLDSAGKIDWRSKNAGFADGYRFMPGEWTGPDKSLAHWLLVHRFARHGLAPVLGMACHAVDAAPTMVATNTPAIALSTYMPRLSEALMDTQGFAALCDEPEDPECLLRRATPEGLAIAWRRPF